MHITHLSLTNFRNYGRLELNLPLGTTLLHGNNAQGKTNFLEAIFYLATSRSPHASSDYQLINWDAARAEDPVIVGRLVADLVTNTGPHQIELRLIKERQGLNGQGSFRREALVDRRKVRLMDLLGNLRVVLFLPQDIQLITGSPSGRRRYLDITICQIDPVYCRNLSNYNKTLEQRNALLRQLVEGNGNREVLPVFTEKLVHLGSQLFARRAKFLAEIAREAQRIHYEELTEGRESIRLSYLPRLQENGRSRDKQQLAALGDWSQANSDDREKIAQRFAQTLAATARAELGRGATIVGPHRDDWMFTINGRPLGSYGSRGQQRSGILALKLAEISWMTAETDDRPILLLDEVVAELDERRRRLLLNYVQTAKQAMLTATDPKMFPKEFLHQCSSMQVENGRIQIDRQPNQT